MMPKFLACLGSMIRSTRTSALARVAACFAYVFGILALMQSYAFAQAPTLPDTGVDLAEWVPVALTALGLIVLAVVGAFFGMKIVHLGLRWMTKINGK